MQLKNKILVVVPARSGSKGLKDKNIKLFHNEPLVVRAIKQAHEIFEKDQVFLSTDSKRYLAIVKKHTDLTSNYIRPKNLAKDNSTTKDYLIDIIGHAQRLSKNKYTWVLILQCTSPLRKNGHIIKAMNAIKNGVDMVTSVHLTNSNPFYLHRLIDDDNNLRALLPGKFTRRQDCPSVYELNGMFHLISISSLEQKEIEDFKVIKPVIIDRKYCIDIDDELDFMMAEFLNKQIDDENF